MQITVNGEETELEGEQIKIPELLEKLDVDMPQQVSVELNGEVISRSNFDETSISDGDSVEFLYFMGGG